MKYLLLIASEDDKLSVHIRNLFANLLTGLAYPESRKRAFK